MENDTPDETVELTVEVPTTHNPLFRKAIILAGAVTGMIIAGGIAHMKKPKLDEEEFVVLPSSALDDSTDV